MLCADNLRFQCGSVLPQRYSNSLRNEKEIKYRRTRLEDWGKVNSSKLGREVS